MVTEPDLLDRPDDRADEVAPPRRGAYSGGYSGGYAAPIDEAEIIRQFVPVVKRLAMRLKGRTPETVQLDDLIQAGLIAVLRLARQGGGVAPPTDPALQRSIVNAMIDEARRETWAPVRTVRLAKNASQAMQAVKLRAGRDGTDDEVAAEMGLSLNDYHNVLVDIAGIRLLDIDEFDDLADDAMQVVEERDNAIDKSRMMSALADSIAGLPEREKLVLSLYYEQELNMEEVGAVLGLDKSTVCRVHGRALLMLRHVLADWRADGASPPSGPGD
jgi:RNA polymerase sigma factor for flagellar operon FliA